MDIDNDDENLGTTYSYDPEQIMRDVNISDPEELEAHLQVLNVRQRLRQRRRRMIRCFTVLIVLIVVAFLVGMGLTTREGKENSAIYGGKGVATMGSDTKLPSPPADLASKCSNTSIATSQGLERCQEACEIAECCDVPEGFALSCLAINPEICPRFQRYCQILHSQIGDVQSTITDSESVNNDGTTPVPSPTQLTLAQRIDQLCGEKSDAESASEQDSCESLCAPSLCCFSDYCVPGPSINCMDYAGCYILHAEQSPVEDDDAPAVDGTPTRASEIHDACFASGTITAASNNARCKTLCAPGACCFEPNLACTKVDCVIYAECNILYPSVVSVTQAEVEDACKNHRDVANVQPTLCEQVCTLEVMQCCFHQNNDEFCDDTMQNPGSAYCNNYAACEILGTSGTDIRDAHQSELVTACSSAQLRAKCISLCAAATCCYATTVAESCAKVDASISCEEYSACDVLYGH